MMEKVGKVQLDLSKYSGKDLYTDGTVEEELLQIVRTAGEEDYPRIIEERKQWAVLYHLSALRENIVDWLPITKQDKVLEVGSGCGAITGVLSRKAGEVVCVDLSRQRSLINANRHRDCENVTIQVGNFRDIEPDLPCDYDYICLIGAFEYGRGYIEGETPYEDFLRILLKHLKKGGRLIIAIENQFGLKYFAGCAEDHLGSYFSGIEGYGAEGNARTFGRAGLEKIFRICNVPEWHFYYPYPDYKFMTALYSDEYLPGKGELSNNLRNFDRDRMLLFDEKKAYDEILREGLFPVFSNSYLAVLGPACPAEFVKYSNDRAGDFAVKTVIGAAGELDGTEGLGATDRLDAGKQDPAGEQDRADRPGAADEPDGNKKDRNGEQAEKTVLKLPMTKEAGAHIAGMYAAYQKLTERYAGGNLCINRCQLLDEKDASKGVRFEFVKGRPLSEIMDECLERGDLEGFYRWFREFAERTGYHEEYEAADLDLVFSNIMVSEDQWTLIDYEWTFDRAIPGKLLAYRAAYCYMLENEKRRILDEARLMRELGISEEEAQACRQQEWDFQSYVNGGRLSMAQLRDYMDKEVFAPLEWMDRNLKAVRSCRLQIYEDRGSGFAESESYFVPGAYRGDHTIDVTLSVVGEVKALRIDPMMDSCAVYLKEMLWNGESVDLRNRRLFVSNGSVKRGKDSETGEPMLIFLFSTEDPNILLQTDRFANRKEENGLSIKMQIVRMPAALAEVMADAGRFKKTKDRSKPGLRLKRAAGKLKRKAEEKILYDRKGERLRYEKELSLKKITYDEWVREEEKKNNFSRQEEVKESGRNPVSAAALETAAALEGAVESESVGMPEAAAALVYYAGGGRPAENAKDQIERFFRENPDVVVAYGDEDVESPLDGRRSSPWFKPQWSPDTFQSFFYWGSIMAVRREWLEKVGNSLPEEAAASAQKEGAKNIGELYALAKEFARAAGGFERGCRAIGHIPHILYHGSRKDQQEAFRNFSCSSDCSCKKPGLPADTVVSIIIPSRDNPTVLEQCIQSILRTQGTSGYELIVVDNGSREENRLRVEQTLKTISVKSTYLFQPMPFHFSRMCNLGAERAEGEYLLFLNDDIEMCCSGWLEEMTEKASLPYAGAVGMKLYYPHGKNIQHVGVTNLPNGPVHKLQFLPDDRDYDHGRNKLDWNVLAVTGACLMCSAEKFRTAGGFCEELPIAYNDVDLCFGLWEQGYSNVVLNRIFAYHHESLSRGADDESAGKLERLQAEQRRLYERHPGLLEKDPYFPEGFCHDALDTAVWPAYVTARNIPDTLDVREAELISGDASGVGWEKEGNSFLLEGKSIRKDGVLQVGIGRCDDRMLQGYAVVLGADNARYELTLILCPAEGTSVPEKAGKGQDAGREREAGKKREDGKGQEAGRGQEAGKGQEKQKVYLQRLTGQYRPDLEKNMPRQKNVALSGFCVKWKKAVPEGAYRIGVAAQDRRGGQGLLNWSSFLWRC